MHCNIIAVPDMVQLDLTGPYEVLSRVPGWTVELVAATLNPIRADRGLRLLPDVTRDEAKPSDILLIPGGGGIDVAMLDPEWLAFVQREAAKARYVVTVCTGSLLLGAAGLLKGRRAGGHWQARALLAQFGAVVSDERVTVDGNVYSSGGITSGIDMALRVVGDVAGEAVARSIQLAMEYDPAPPYRGGTPYTSPPDIVLAVISASEARQATRERRVAQAAANLANPLAVEADGVYARNDKQHIGELHKEWVLVGWEKNLGDPPFDLRTKLGKFYAFSAPGVVLYDDFDPAKRVARSAEEYGAFWQQPFTQLRTARHSVIDGPDVVTATHLASSTLEFAAALEAADGTIIGVRTRSTLVWQYRDGAWRIVREHNSSTQISASEVEALLRPAR